MDLICIFCLEPIDKILNKKTLECEHMFHYECINEYKIYNQFENIICPICKNITYNKYNNNDKLSYLDIILLLILFILINNFIYFISHYLFDSILYIIDIIIIIIINKCN